MDKNKVCSGLVPYFYSIIGLITICEIVGESRREFILRIAAIPLVFAILQAFLLVTAFLIIHEVWQHCLGRLSRPGELLGQLEETNWKVATSLSEAGKAQTREQKLMNLAIASEPVCAAIHRVRRRSVLMLLMHLLILILVLSLSTMVACAYFEANGEGTSRPFAKLSVNCGFLRHVYFAVVTLVTLGYGEIYSLNEYGYAYVISVCGLAISLVVLGVAFAVGHWYYMVARLEKDLEYRILG